MAITSDGLARARSCFRSSAAGPAAYIFTGAIVFQSFHMLEHTVQVIQAFVLHILPPHGILGSLFDQEWVHFFDNTYLYVFLSSSQRC
ncbi:MAG TPA: hypothetical protein VNF73_04815 [Candidatus Saccharimonadales bacterium]|nr:hypothetical protein [Candidatus Saccharimonadales bacterium]